MNKPILFIISITLCTALIIAIRFVGLEGQAKANVKRARSLPQAFDYARGTAPQNKTAQWVSISMGAPGSVITEADIDILPEPAQRYFRNAQVAGKNRISSFSVILEGRIRNGPTEPWMPLIMRQYNRLDNPARVVYLSSTKPPMKGIDSFLEGQGRMLIKAMDLIKVVDSKGPEMAISAFVTFLNDLTLCPLAYFSLPLKFRQIGSNSIELSMTYAGMAVSAVMTVDSEGRPVNWRSEDRYAEVKGRNLKDRWATPFEGSKEIAGLRIPEKGAGIHDYDGNPYIYVELDRIHSLVLDANSLPEDL
ncbi:DUF6544 family protein [Gracilinema caldarium]|uniref:DUF6544 family protein n=1 Tax=Gracilinema caldarium TaxID=215591 RepID=UPI0026ED4428|nr:DUF6544 family protein [Gracilinema caldarium]